MGFVHLCLLFLSVDGHDDVLSLGGGACLSLWESVFSGKSTSSLTRSARVARCLFLPAFSQQHAWSVLLSYIRENARTDLMAFLNRRPGG